MSLKKDLSIDFLGVKCENPFFLSSSPVGSNYEMCAKALEAGWGGIYYKTIGIFIPDECSPRFDITTKEGTPWVGFKNMEQISDKPLEVNLEYMRRLKQDYPNKVIVASIMGSNDEEWTTLAKAVTEAGVDMIEGIAAIKTVKAITNIDIENITAMPVVNGKSSISGYSGAAVKPIALRFITQMKQHPDLVNVPITGVGGIETWRDALEFILVGASNLQVTTAVMQYGYRIVEDMISGLSHYMEDNGIEKLSDLVGLALPNIVPAEDLDRSFKLLPKFDEDACAGCGRCYVSCFDGGHQAIDWDEEARRPRLNTDKCVGCHLCLNVCPVMDCITPGEIVIKPGREEHEIKIKTKYE